jgi:zinc and cadmium transporter
MLNLSSTFLYIFLFAVAAAIINAVGIFVVYKRAAWAKRVMSYFMCFAAGVLISTPLILALPQAIDKNFYAGFAALAGFLFMVLSNKLIQYYSNKKELTFGIIAAEGIGIHSFVDGIIYTVTFSVSLLTGFLSGIGLVVHEFAEGVITYVFLNRAGIGQKKSLMWAILIASLTTPIGAFIAYPLINRLDQGTLGLMLGFVSGVLIYVSASHLLPEAREYQQHHSIIALLIGVLLAFFIVFTKIG